jgi:hypothetical protein
MPMYESPQQKRDRLMRQQVSYPELKMATPSQLLNTDSYTASQGRLPSQATQSMYRTANIASQEVRERSMFQRPTGTQGVQGRDRVEQLREQGAPSGVPFGDILSGIVNSRVGQAVGDTFGQMTDFERFLTIGPQDSGIRVGEAIGEQVERVPGVGGALRDVLRIAGAPVTLATAGIGPQAAAGLRGAGVGGRAIESVLGPTIQSQSWVTRLAGETAISLGAQKAGEAVYERTENPLLALAAGLVGGVGTAGAISGVRAGVRALDEDLAGQAIRQATGAADESVLSPAMRPMRGATQRTVDAAEEVLPDGGVRFRGAFHGTGDVVSLDPARAGTSTGNPTAQWGTFFTPSRTEAERYVSDFHGGSGSVLAADVTLRRPYRMPFAEFDRFTNLDLAAGNLDEQMQALTRQAAEFKDELVREGYDGIVVGAQGKSRPQEIVAFTDRALGNPSPFPGAIDPVIPGVTPKGRGRVTGAADEVPFVRQPALDERLVERVRQVVDYIRTRPAGFSLEDISKSDNPIDRATAKLVTGLQEERRLRRTGVAGRELAEGRRAQAEAVRQARESAVARGLSGEDILKAESAAARTGPLRRTFTTPDWDDEEFDVLLRMLNDSEIASDFDTLGLGIALSNWRKGIAPPQPKQIRNIGRILGGEVQGIADDVASEARAYAREMQEIARMRRGLDSTSRQQTARFLRQEADDATKQIAERRGLLRVTDEDLPLPPKPSLEVQRRAALQTPEAARRAGVDPTDVTRAKSIVKSYDEAVMRHTRQQFDDVERQLLALETAERKMDEVFTAQRRAWETADQRLARETREMNERMSRQRPVQAGKDVDERIAALDRAEIERLSRATTPETRMPILDDATARRLEQQEIAAGRARQERVEAAGARPSRATNAQQVRAQEAWDRANPNPEMILRNVPQRLKGNKDAEEIIRAWLMGNRAIVDRVNGGDSFNVFRRIEAGVRGEVADSAVNAILVRESLLSDVLMRSGVDLEDAKKIARSLTNRELMLKYGVSAPSAIPAPVREMIRDARNIPYEKSVGGLLTLNQQAKNTMFGLTDAGIFGQQALAAVHNGGIPAVAGMVNRLLGMAHLPHIQTMLSDINLPKQMQYAVDGVNVGLKASGLEPGAGTLLRRLGKPGRVADDFITPIIDKWTEFQFSTVLGNLRQIIYEGDLMMAKAAGQDITNPAVRFRAAENANHITSFSRSATKATRRATEELLFTSPSMNRARVARINDMAKLLGPTTPPDERLFAASMIFSNVLMTMAVGKLIYDQIGVGEFTIDPSDPNYGKITTAATNDKGQNLVVDYLPQDSIQRAFAQSIRAIMDADPQQVAEVWARAGISGGSPVSRPAATGLGFSYDPGSGYNIFDYPESAASAVAGMIPIPPIAQSLLRGETGAIEMGSEAIAVPTYPESPSAASRDNRFSGLRGRARFEGIPSETWRTLSTDPELSDVATRYRSAGEFYATLHEQAMNEALRSGMSRGEAEVEADSAVTTNPLYQEYLDRRASLRTQWVEENVEEAVKLWDEESAKPWDERSWSPTKAQREIMESYLAGRREPVGAR